MRYEGGAEPARTGPATVEHPQATVTKSRGVLHSTRKTGVRPVRASRERSKLLPAVLYFAAFGCLIAVVCELPEHPVHAAILIAGAALLWLVGEAAS